jgi:hypothetical protein
MLIQHFGGPIVIAVIGQVIGALVGWGALVMWFREIELSVDPHGLERSTRMLGRQGTRTVPAADVAGITYVSNTRVNDTSYYAISLKLKEGDDVRLVSGLRARDAEWIAGEIAQSLGVASEAEAPAFARSSVEGPSDER